MLKPTDKQLEFARAIGIDPKALKGIDRKQLSSVIRLKMREGGKEKLKADDAERFRKIVEEKGLKPGVRVTYGPMSEGSKILHVKRVTSDYHVSLEEHPDGRFNPVGLYPVEDVPEDNSDN